MTEVESLVGTFCMQQRSTAKVSHVRAKQAYCSICTSARTLNVACLKNIEDKVLQPLEVNSVLAIR